MPFESDSYHVPLRPRPKPLVPIDTLLAINTVTLAGNTSPRKPLRDFYTRLLGLTLRDSSDTALTFSYLQRTVVLDFSNASAPPGQLGLLVRNMSDILDRLRAQAIHHEVLHDDTGLTRAVLLRDPAGNNITLLESRPL